MEKKHVRRLREKFNESIDGKKVTNLDIPDDYIYMDEQLIEILKSRVSQYIDVPD
ncbi:MAG TPA: hypothetical protein VIO64_05320 [Pseudobacteroides sp.]|uniref:hypothetical protein n=1 Tax=Pseudobacteroides sp. TaxID=1968840 RepID=UPI002F92EFCC